MNIEVILSAIITFAISSGQLIKAPISNQSGPILLDFTILIFCIFGLIKNKLIFKKLPNFLITPMIFVLIAILSLVFSPLNLTHSEILISFSYTIRLSAFILFSLLIYSKVFFKKEHNISFILISSSTILATLGILQILFIPDLSFLQSLGWDPHYFRAASTFLDPNFLGAFLVLALILLSQKSQRINKWTSIKFIILYIAIFATFSRSSYLMFFVSFVILSLLQKSLKLLLLTFLLTSVLLIGFYGYTQAVSKPRNINREVSASSRLSTWQQGIKIFKQSPIIGVGFNSYRYALRQYNLAEDDFNNTRGASANDSSLLFVLTTTGLAGFITYLTFLYLVIKRGLSVFFSGNYFGAVVVAGIGGLLIHSIFNNTLFYPPILAWMALCLSQLNPKR